MQQKQAVAAHLCILGVVRQRRGADHAGDGEEAGGLLRQCQHLGGGSLRAREPERDKSRAMSKKR